MIENVVTNKTTGEVKRLTWETQADYDLDMLMATINGYLIEFDLSLTTRLIK